MRLVLTLILSLFSSGSLANEYMTNVHYRQFNDNGIIENSMHAEYITYSDEKITITKPQISQNNWQLSALTAVTTTKPQIISFYNEVTIIDNLDPSLNIKTQKLDYLINEKTLTNSDYVVFKKNNVLMSGYGLNANLTENKIKILDKVHTILEVN